eukprot:12170382-Ditylum_brightwellii.AAC.1
MSQGGDKIEYYQKPQYGTAQYPVDILADFCSRNAAQQYKFYNDKKPCGALICCQSDPVKRHCVSTSPLQSQRMVPTPDKSLPQSQS